jgi:hypothetical protein
MSLFGWASQRGRFSRWPVSRIPSQKLAGYPQSSFATSIGLDYQTGGKHCEFPSHKLPDLDAT